MDSIEELILRRIDENRETIIEFARDIYQHPEPGFYEKRTASMVRQQFQKLGLKTEAPLAITGVKAYLKEKQEQQERKQTNLCILAELDAIECASHPYADETTHVAHACGHHAQLAAMIGAAIAFSDEEVKKSLDGNVTFFAVPAEEYVDYQRKEKLINQKLIQFGSGKSELIRIGAFDDIDLCLISHAHLTDVKEELLLGNSAWNGFLPKRVVIHGKASHAANAPWDGVNALNVAALGMNAVGLLRETFREEDYIRIHSVIREGGRAVNVVPDKVSIEALLRAKSIKSLEQVSQAFNRAYEGCAHALGASVELFDEQGYLPVDEVLPCNEMIEAATLISESTPGIRNRSVCPGNQIVASTDVGDLIQVKPVQQFTFGGCQGALHSKEFQVLDEEKAYIVPAKLFALTGYRLLRNGAVGAKRVISDYTPQFTKEGYVSYIEKRK